MEKKKGSWTCWKPPCHAYLPMGFKNRESSKPPSCRLLLQVNITPAINGACTILPTCSLYSLHIACPVALNHVKKWKDDLTFERIKWDTFAYNPSENISFQIVIVIQVPFYNNCYKLLGHELSQQQTEFAWTSRMS